MMAVTDPIPQRNTWNTLMIDVTLAMKKTVISDLCNEALFQLQRPNEKAFFKSANY